MRAGDGEINFVRELDLQEVMNRETQLIGTTATKEVQERKRGKKRFSIHTATEEAEEISLLESYRSGKSDETSEKEVFSQQQHDSAETDEVENEAKNGHSKLILLALRVVSSERVRSHPCHKQAHPQVISTIS